MAVLGLSSPAYAQSCAGSTDALTVGEWSVDAVDSQDSPNVQISVSLTNEMDRGFRLIDGSILFNDALGGSFGGIEIPRPTKADAGETFVVDGNYSTPELASIASVHPDDVVVIACMRAAVSSDGDIIDEPRRAGTPEPVSRDPLSQFEIASRLCWSPPIAAQADSLSVTIAVELNIDGSVASTSIVGEPATDLELSTALSAQRAIEQCSPYAMLPEKSYEQWKAFELTMDAADL